MSYILGSEGINEGLVKWTRKALLLTPFIEAGEISEALNRSRVSELLPNVHGNAAFLTVNKTYNSNLFFWFIRKTSSNWEAAPLLLWLQGGPGCSSMFSLFGETGPFIITKQGLRRRRYAWTNDYNVLYIDQPVGVGYSFTNSKKGYISTQEEVGEHLYRALVQFFQLYPQLRNNFYVSGESYAGKYLPTIAYKIHHENMFSNFTINLKGLFIVSGFSDPISIVQLSEFTYKIGLIDNRRKRSVAQLESKTRAYIRSGLWKNASNLCGAAFDELHTDGEIGSYNYMLENFGGDDTYIDYIQSDEIRKSIHVGDAKYDPCSDNVWHDFQIDLLQSVKPVVEELLEHYPIAYVGGQLDVIVAYPLVVSYLQSLQWSDAEKYNFANREIWRVGEHVAGYFKIAGNLKDVMVRAAGHMVPADQPKAVLTLLKMFINNKLS